MDRRFVWWFAASALLAICSAAPAQPTAPMSAPQPPPTTVTINVLISAEVNNIIPGPFASDVVQLLNLKSPDAVIAVAKEAGGGAGTVVVNIVFGISSAPTTPQDFYTKFAAAVAGNGGKILTFTVLDSVVMNYPSPPPQKFALLNLWVYITAPAASIDTPTGYAFAHDLALMMGLPQYQVQFWDVGGWDEGPQTARIELAIRDYTLTPGQEQQLFDKYTAALGKTGGKIGSRTVDRTVWLGGPPAPMAPTTPLPPTAPMVPMVPMVPAAPLPPAAPTPPLYGANIVATIGVAAINIDAIAFTKALAQLLGVPESKVDFDYLDANGPTLSTVFFSFESSTAKSEAEAYTEFTKALAKNGNMIGTYTILSIRDQQNPYPSDGQYATLLLEVLLTAPVTSIGAINTTVPTALTQLMVLPVGSVVVEKVFAYNAQNVYLLVKIKDYTLLTNQKLYAKYTAALAANNNNIGPWAVTKTRFANGPVPSVDALTIPTVIVVTIAAQATALQTDFDRGIITSTIFLMLDLPAGSYLQLANIFDDGPQKARLYIGIIDSGLTTLQQVYSKWDAAVRANNNMLGFYSIVSYNIVNAPAVPQQPTPPTAPVAPTPPMSPLVPAAPLSAEAPVAPVIPSAPNAAITEAGVVGSTAVMRITVNSVNGQVVSIVAMQRDTNLQRLFCEDVLRGCSARMFCEDVLTGWTPGSAQSVFALCSVSVVEGTSGRNKFEAQAVSLQATLQLANAVAAQDAIRTLKSSAADGRIGTSSVSSTITGVTPTAANTPQAGTPPIVPTPPTVPAPPAAPQPPTAPQSTPTGATAVVDLTIATPPSSLNTAAQSTIAQSVTQIMGLPQNQNLVSVLSVSGTTFHRKMTVSAEGSIVQLSINDPASSTAAQVYSKFEAAVKANGNTVGQYSVVRVSSQAAPPSSAAWRQPANLLVAVVVGLLAIVMI